MSVEANKGFDQEMMEMQLDKAMLEKSMSGLSGEVLDQVISKGIARGKQTMVSRRRGRIGFRIGIAAVCMLLLLTAFIRVSPSFAALMKEIPGLNGFIELIEADRSLKLALDNEFVQPVNVSDEKNGYKLSVGGIIADEKRLVILYSIEGEGLHDPSFHPRYQFLDENGVELRGMISYWQLGDHLPNKEGLRQDYIDIILDPEVAMPEHIQFRALFGGEWLEVDVPIDHGRFEGLSERLELNKRFEVSGQQFMIKEAIITPLQVSLKIESNPGNKLRSNGLIGLALLDEKGRRYESRSSMGDLDGIITAHFQSSYFERPKKLTLVAGGLYLSKRNLSLTVDTDSMETLAGPDRNIQLSGKRVTDAGYEIKLDLLQLDEIDLKWRHWLLDEGTPFKDAAGTEYSLLPHEGTATEWRAGSDKVSYYYSIPNADYVQPLTFKLSLYPGYVLEDIRIPIK